MMNRHRISCTTRASCGGYGDRGVCGGYGSDPAEADPAEALVGVASFLNSLR